MRRVAAVLVSLAALSVSPGATAKLMTFTATYGPSSDAPSAVGSAVATFTIDTEWISAVYVDTTYKAPITMDRVINFSLTIQGANVGNGTYGAADFQGIIFDYWGPLDFSKQLIGQTYVPPDLTYKSLPFGSTNSGWGGNFGIVGAVGSNYPTEFMAFEMLTNGQPANGKANDLLRVTSLTAVPYAMPSAVPEPSRIAMLLAGLGLTGFIARRKSNRKSECSRR